MSWLLILIIIIFLLNILFGYHKGFLRTIFSLVGWIAILIIAKMIVPYIAEFVITETEITTTFQETITETLEETLTNGIEEVIFEEHFPPVLREWLFEEHGTFAEVLTNNTQYTAFINNLIFGSVSILIYIIIFLSMGIILFIIDKVLGIASKLPIIGSFDKILGIIIGAMKGLLYCWIVLTIITVLALTGTNTSYIELVYESELLTWLYENNLLLNTISSVLGK